MTIGICGASSTIAQQFMKLMPHDEEVIGARPDTMDLMLDRYLICTGYLAGNGIWEITDAEATETFMVNFVTISKFLDKLFAINARARVVVIGSESGISGSYDACYAGAKAALHLYVETKQLPCPDQMLVALAPHIVLDSGMTRRRPDLAETIERGKQTRLGRWLTAKEVAAEAVHLLYHASPSLSGQIIRMRAD